MYTYLWNLFFLLLLLTSQCEAKLPNITPQDASSKVKEIMKAHASYKKLTPALVQRILSNYLEELDPNKTYFIEPDIEPWTQPSEALLEQIIQDYEDSNFNVFEKIHEALMRAIERRHRLE